jgi:PKD repeat protein
MLYSQAWFKIDPNERRDNRYTLPEYQQMFEGYWEGKEIELGYYYENGKKKKAHGWKQFRRWENFWESRVNPDGSFPSRQQIADANRVYRSGKSRSSQGNWQNLGPSSSNGGYAGVGRINQIAFHPDDPNAFWVTTPQGGLWYTPNSGQTWQPLTDETENLTCSAIAVPPDYSTSQTIYLGTGEMDSWQYDNGIGLLKSTDGGQTWQTTGLTFDVTESISVNRILIHPQDYNFLYAGTTNGIYISEDAGNSWVKIYNDDYIADMEFDPTDPSVVFASNKYYGRIYKITGDGADVRVVYNQFGDGARRIELAVAPSSPNIVYAVVSDFEGGLKSILKSTDSGDSYQTVFVSEATSSKPNLLTWAFDGGDTGGQGDYDLALVVDPTDHNTVYCAGINNWRSTDGGVTWHIVNYWTNSGGSGVQTVHADKHFLAFNGNLLYECNDGGLYRSPNGVNWDNISNGIRNSQIYKIGLSQTAKYDIIAGLQDNGTKSYVDGQWYDVIGGDGMDCMIDHLDPDIQYGELYYGYLRRTTNHWGNRRNIQPEGSEGAWITPLAMHPVDPSIIYAGYQHVYRSFDRGDNWEIMFDRNASGKFRTLSIAPSNPDVLYAGESQRLWRTTDDGANWTDITAGLPDLTITGIAVSDDDPDLLWVTLGGYNAHGIYESNNGGQSWRNISAGLPNIPVNTVVHNAQNDQILELYIGTDFGVYFRLGEDNWTLFNMGMPKVVITDLEIYYDAIPANSRLRAATYGRGLWETDLYSVELPPVAEFSADNATVTRGQTVNFADLTLYSPFVWQWTFEGGTPASSNQINPSVSYNEPGVYDVQLIVSNGTGRDTLLKEDFISVSCETQLNYLAENAQHATDEYQDLGDLGTEIPVANFDDANSEPIEIGFEFEYNCDRFTHFILNTNGLIKLGDTPPSTASLFHDPDNAGAVHPFESVDPADQQLIVPLNLDLEGTENSGFRVHTSGEAPDRICTIQFSGLREKDNDTNHQYDYLSFQVRLYETTNIIEFLYDGWLPTGNDTRMKPASCGLKGTGTDDQDVLLVRRDDAQAWDESIFTNSQYPDKGAGFLLSNQENGQPAPGQLFRFVPRFFRDLIVRQIYAQTQSPAEFGNPETIQAAVYNSGYNDLHNVEVKLKVSGANNLESTTVIEVIPSGKVGIAEFEPVQPAALGTNHLTVVLPEDEFPEGNTLAVSQEVNRTRFSYANDTGADTGLGLPAGESGILSVRFRMQGNAWIRNVDAYLFDHPGNTGRALKAVIQDQEGEILASSDTLIISPEQLGTWVRFELNEPPLIIDHDFLAADDEGSSFGPLGAQAENPTRENTYFTSGSDGENTQARLPGYGYKYMISVEAEPLLLEGYTVTTNDSLLCTGEKGRVSIDVKPDGMEWQSSDSGLGGWKSPEGGFGLTNKTYLTDNLEGDQYFRVKAPHESGGTAYSNVVRLYVYPHYEVQDSAVLCSGDSYLFPDGKLLEGITENMDYVSLLETVYGCDSIVKTRIEVLPASYSLDTDTICRGDSYLFPDGLLLEDIQTDTLYEIAFPLTNGCDSVLATRLYVRLSINEVTQTDSSLIAGPADVIYQWIDCENGNSVLEGENNREFVPERSGWYAVIVIDAECVDTSACMTFIHSSTAETADRGIRLFPNPARDRVTLTSDDSMIRRVRLIGLTGTELQSIQAFPSRKEMEISLAGMRKGLIIVEILTSNGLELRKLVLE